VGLLKYDDHVLAVERESEALAVALSAGDGAQLVTTCPGWDLRDLAGHVGGVVEHWVHTIAVATGDTPPDLPGSGAAETDDLAGWWRSMAAPLVSALRSVEAATDVPTWVQDQTAGFVARRTAHELAVHRVDAQLAVGAAAPIEAALASDGIDEIFTLIAAAEPTSGGRQASFHLHGTDRPEAGDEWLVILGSDGVTVSRRHAKGDLALRGAVGDLELLLYGRPPVASVERFGDESVLDAWYEAFQLG
jgi:uncharacterized protein (TIGR03083 family)